MFPTITFIYGLGFVIPAAISLGSKGREGAGVTSATTLTPLISITILSVLFLGGVGVGFGGTGVGLGGTGVGLGGTGVGSGLGGTTTGGFGTSFNLWSVIDTLAFVVSGVPLWKISGLAPFWLL
ncbi:hypothetical protein AFAEFNGA_00593 [Mycoplasmopsis arginini]|nr:putative immunoglobulin-blocking virulence protein [Mycoplasmopsis arginini QMP CG1-2758]MDI3350224.1 hypothetical protein [Mycoplasmopsis arginini]MDI3350739.1 hypothetical protein [Mycoplasmopsis arginini]MDI3352340.1 hypothetical protein [Mycoplasmopsis arginini]